MSDSEEWLLDRELGQVWSHLDFWGLWTLKSTCAILCWGVYIIFKWGRPMAFFRVSEKWMTFQKAKNLDIRGLKSKAWKEPAFLQFV